MLRNSLFLILYMMATFSVSAQSETERVSYIEKQNNGATRVFVVRVAASKKVEDMKAEAGRTLLLALLFDGVESYNGGRPLCDESMMRESAKLYVNQFRDPKSTKYISYCKEENMHMEGVPTKVDAHFIVRVNHFLLLRHLREKNALADEFEEN